MSNPRDSFVEFVNTSYHETDKLLQELYPTDADYQVYEGACVDNYVGYGPHIVEGKSYDYVVILETARNCWTCWQRVVFTNDSNWVDSIVEMLSEDES